MNNNKIKLVVFDMAGTTVHDERFVAQALCETLGKHGYTTTVEAANNLMGIPKPVAIAHLIEQAGGKVNGQVAIIHQDFLENMIDFYKNRPGIREIEGATEVFKTLRERGIKVALDTGFSRDITDTIINRLGWNDNNVLDATIASDEVENGRPHPDMIFKLMEQLEISDAQAVAKVGDTPVDLQEGTSAGCKIVIGVLGGAYEKADLEKFEHTALLSSVRDVPQFIHNYEEELVA